MEERIYKPSYHSIEDLKNKCGIYQIRNLVNGKIYVGSSRTLARRAQIHLNSLRKNKHENYHLQQAYNKYGEENLVFEIIEFCSLAEQFDIEQYWIDRFFGKNCYNMCPDAIKPPDGTGRTVIISEAQKKYLSELQKKRLQNPEERLKLSLRARGRNMNELNKWSHPVVCLETGMEYPCMAEATRQTGVDRRGISSCCSGNSHTAGGLHWRWREDYVQLTKDDIDNIILTGNGNVQVVCLETRKIYKSMREVVEELSLYGSSQISLCCQGKLNSVCGFHWAYYEDYLKMSPEDIDNKLNLKVGSSEAIYCVETGQLFESITKASKILGIDRNKIADCCSGSRFATPQGYHFLYAHDYEMMSDEDRKKLIEKKDIKKRGPRMKRVRCIETGVIYETIAEATNAMGKNPRNSHISACCRGKRRVAFGYHWEYAT